MTHRGHMSNNKKHPNHVGITSGLAARMLSASLGESEVIWLKRLANWRRPGRKQPIGWIEREQGHPVYVADEVQTYIDNELAQRPLTSVPQSTSNDATASATADASGSECFVRVVWNAGNAQGTFCMSPESAAQLAMKLGTAAQRALAIRNERLT